MQPPRDETLRTLLEDLYPDNSSGDLQDLSSQLLQILGPASVHADPAVVNHCWNGDDVVLITYADSVVDDAKPGLQGLRSFVNRHLQVFAPVIHVLPFLESTSDGGFAVSSHEQLESRHGDWSDLAALAKGRRLMADLVLNHVSASHPWVRQFLRDEEPGRLCVLEAAPDPCWDDVVRPRSSALFTYLQSSVGQRQVWTTFGPDQVDLDWRCPEVLLGFTRLLKQKLAHGVRWIRLDAVGFVWKEPNTSCIHRPQVHRLVEVLRHLLTYACTGSGVVVTETNVPEEENLSYLRSGREAHLAYNFPLPPLLMEAAMSGSADLLNRWLSRWPQLPNSTALLNFTACHDGVGLRPLEGLMPQRRLLNLLIACEQRGGLVSHRRLADGDDVPYEINISWWSAMADSGRDPSHHQRSRFLLTQLLLLALPGVPAFYLPALLATPNDNASFRRTGHRRALNRPQFQLDRLERLFADPESETSQVTGSLRRAMEVRRGQSALDPFAAMTLLSKDRSDLVILQRGDENNMLVAIHNFSDVRLSLSLSTLADSSGAPWHDALSGRSLVAGQQALDLEPFAVHWLVR